MSTGTESDLGRLAVERGLLSPAQLEECARLSRARGGSLRDQLLERGYLDEEAWRGLHPRAAGASEATIYEGEALGAPEASPDPEELASARPFGRYRLVQEIGRGGMGVVYKAWDPVLSRWVALKMLLTQEDEQVDRFLREARSTARLRHPHIVQILDIGTHGDRNFFTMEFVEGASLEKILEEGRGDIPRLGESSIDFVPGPARDPLERWALPGPFSLRETLLLVRSVARALHYAHQNGLVHRDVKPANILVDTRGTPLLTDFGLAKQLGNVAASGITLAGALVGTPRYMSPEQAKGRNAEIGPASDIYSLGAVFYELLTGRCPFAHESLPQLLLAILKETPTPPSDRVARASTSRSRAEGLPREVDLVCLKALEKEPADRFPDAEAMAHEIDAALAGQAVSVRPGRMMRRMSSRRSRASGSLARRRQGTPHVAIAATVASVVAAALIGLALHQPDPASQESKGTPEPVAKQESRDPGDPDPAPGPGPAPLPEPADAARRGRAEPFYQKARFRVVESRAAWEQAIEHLDRALEIDPTYGEAHFERGMLLYRLGRYEAALPDLEACASLEVAAVLAHYTRGWIHLLVREDQPAADADFELAVAKGAGDSYAEVASVWRLIIQQDYRTALARCLELAGRRELEWDLQFARGWALWKTREDVAAEEAFSRAVDLHPDFPMAWRMRAVLAATAGRLDDAVRDAERCLELRPDDARTLEILGMVHMKRKEFAEAIDLLDRAVTLAGDRLHSIRYNRGQSSLALGMEAETQGRRAEAIASYRRAADDFEAFLRAAAGSSYGENARRYLEETRRRIEALR